MHYTGRVYILQATEHIEHDGFDVTLGKVELATIHLAKVAGHGLEDEVECFEFSGVIRFQNIV